MKCPVCSSKKVVAHGFQKGDFKHTYQECLTCKHVSEVINERNQIQSMG